MMYMIQLVQEGYRITDDMRTQLQQDLHYKVCFLLVHLLFYLEQKKRRESKSDGDK